ncbi:MAG: hypothetical protein IPM82_27210 [Saprospiraceae bacterium]|nr:hypothetical protein [Saprospiraceae bacterium]
MADLLPGQGYPSELADCDQVNCVGCNPVGPQGMKNTLAANAIALTLSLRYSVEYNGANMQGMLAQSLGCLSLNQNIYFCPDNGNCYLHVFDASGVEHIYSYTLGGLLDLANDFLGGDIVFTDGQSGVYATALNEALEAVTGQDGSSQPPVSLRPRSRRAGGRKCQQGIADNRAKPFLARLGQPAPNPAGRR